MSLGWGILGPGRLADTAIAPAIVKQPNSHLAAILSRDLARAQDFARRHGVGAAYDDYNRLLADPGVDIVYVATPNSLHPSETIAALQAGKHVLVEKPMALSLADGREMVKTARDLGRHLAVGFHLRHKPSSIAAKQAIAEGRLGRVFYAAAELGASKSLFPYATWRADPALAGGGTLINQGTHAIDIMRFLTAQNVVSVSAQADQLPLEDVFAAACKLENGAVAVLTSQQLRAGTRPEYVIFGERGWIRGTRGTRPDPHDVVTLHDDGGETVIGTSEHPAYVYEVDSFVQGVLGHAPLSGDGDDGLHNIAIVEAIYRSAREGREVNVEPIW